MSELEIYRSALQRIANLNCASCERYVAEADAIAIEALVLGENVNDVGIENDVVSGSRAKAA
jgi:hypothetical protein